MSRRQTTLEAALKKSPLLRAVQDLDRPSPTRQSKPDASDQVTCRLGDGSCARAHASHLSSGELGGRSRAADSVLKLQGQYGNRFVRRVVTLARQAEQAEEDDEVSEDVEAAIQTNRGHGMLLDSGVRMQMESAFGTDFSRVRVHTGAQADSINQSLSANAFTLGSDIFFRQGAYAPGTAAGQKLLAHELVHVLQDERGLGVRFKLTVSSPGDRQEQEADAVAETVVRSLASGTARSSTPASDQQAGDGRRRPDEEQGGRIEPAAPMIQRDLATPPPETAPAAQPDLTDSQIQAAIRFNRHLYDETNTRLIQDIVGTEPTGTWVEADIIAVAQIQEEYGLTKDGMVGFNTFRWLDTEIRNEGLERTDENCLVSFNIDLDPQNIVPSAAGAQMTRHFSMHAQFPSYCNCSHFQYRQFIRGHFNIERGGAVRDMGTWFANLPLGRLNAAWQEDGHTGVPSVNFGHRDRSSEGDNRYLNDAGRVDMANGCRYEGDDTPGGNFTGWAGFVPATGDVFDIDMRFRGEIRRSGRVIQTKYWTGPRSRFTLP